MLGVGEKDKPLLSSSSSSWERFRLLRLCTVRTVSAGFGGLEINDMASYVSLMLDVVL